MRVNGRALGRLLCVHTERERTTYIFKSPLLRMNPMVCLPGGNVKVYYDDENMKNYFVDIDGSVETKMIQL